MTTKLSHVFENHHNYRSLARFVLARRPNNDCANVLAVIGIGLAITKFLLRAPESNNVVLLARTKAPLEELRAQYPRQVRILSGDLADFSMGRKAAELAVMEFGQIDGLIVNHGMLPRTAKVDDSDPDEWRQCFDINFFSAIALVCTSSKLCGRNISNLS